MSAINMVYVYFSEMQSIILLYWAILLFLLTGLTILLIYISLIVSIRQIFLSDILSICETQIKIVLCSVKMETVVLSDSSTITGWADFTHYQRRKYIYLNNSCCELFPRNITYISSHSEKLVNALLKQMMDQSPVYAIYIYIKSTWPCRKKYKYYYILY